MLRVVSEPEPQIGVVGLLADVRELVPVEIVHQRQLLRYVRSILLQFADEPLLALCSHEDEAGHFVHLSLAHDAAAFTIAHRLF